MKKVFTICCFCAIALTSMGQKNDYPLPDKIAQFPGGSNAMALFLQDNLQYPNTSKLQLKEGRVLVRFVVDKDGSIKKLAIKESPDESLSKEALRVVSLMPRWTPAEQGGKPIKMRFTLPINFNLASKVAEQITEEQLITAAVGCKENPRGLYRLQKTVFDDGRADLITPYKQYKYCSDNNSMQLVTRKNAENDFQISITEPREGVLNYTGPEPVDGDSTKARVFDSNGNSFKLKWFQNEAKGIPYYPWHTYSTEIYHNKIGIEPEVTRIIEMMKCKEEVSSQNPFIGCWHCFGMPVKIDEMDILLAWPQDTYAIFADEDFLTLFNLDNSTISAYVNLRPISYLPNGKGFVADKKSEVEWINKDSFLQTFQNIQGEHLTVLWKRSGLPRNIQNVFGTDYPVHELVNKLPDLFR